jgi:hypothetical protein
LTPVEAVLSAVCSDTGNSDDRGSKLSNIPEHSNEYTGIISGDLSNAVLSEIMEASGSPDQMGRPGSPEATKPEFEKNLKYGNKRLKTGGTRESGYL